MGLDFKQKEAIIKQYCDWANQRVDDGLAELTELRPFRYQTFRLWLHYNYKDMSEHLDELFNFLCDNVEYAED